MVGGGKSTDFWHGIIGGDGKSNLTVKPNAPEGVRKDSYRIRLIDGWRTGCLSTIFGKGSLIRTDLRRSSCVSDWLFDQLQVA